MKFILGVMIMVLSAGASGQTLQEVEKMTPDEVKQLALAQQRIDDATAQLAAAKEQIAIAHKFKSESWMEWQTWVAFDGEFILRYYHNSMPMNLGVISGGIVR
jgi:hypothetical protein